ncbi:MAG TPA: hypothetical protein VKV26_00635 [Dehalococcoidia bacterium]|nr:hypothetical protein [Dehalococcoidia bacterium]
MHDLVSNALLERGGFLGDGWRRPPCVIVEDTGSPLNDREGCGNAAGARRRSATPEHGQRCEDSDVLAVAAKNTPATAGAHFLGQASQIREAGKINRKVARHNSALA